MQEIISPKSSKNTFLEVNTANQSAEDFYLHNAGIDP